MVVVAQWQSACALHICDRLWENQAFLANQKNEFFMLIKSYNLSQLSAKILEGKTFDSHRNWQLNWAVFSKAIELEIVKT